MSEPVTTTPLNLSLSGDTHPLSVLTLNQQTTLFPSSCPPPQISSAQPLCSVERQPGLGQTIANFGAPSSSAPLSASVSASNPTSSPPPAPADGPNNNLPLMEVEPEPVTNKTRAFDPRINRRFWYEDVIRKFPALPEEGGFCRKDPDLKLNKGEAFCLLCGKVIKTTHTIEACLKARKAALGKNSPEPRFSLTFEDASDLWVESGAKLLAPDQWDLSLFANFDPGEMFSGVLSLHFVPKDARISFSNLVKDILGLCIKRVPGAFPALLMIPRLILPSRIRGNRAAARTMALVGLFRLGSFRKLIEARNIVFPTAPHDKKRKAKTLACAGELSRAARALRAPPVLDPLTCLDELKKLHPESSETLTYPGNPGRDPFSLDDVKDAVKALKKMKAADTLGWTGDILKQLYPDAVALLARLCLIIVNDLEFIPQNIRPFFFGARLVVLKKKRGGIRPIAIGTVFRKLIASTIMLSISSELPGFFGPIQFGVGMKGGTENVVHAIRELTRRNFATHILSLDLANAFNTISRKFIIDQVNKHFPLLNNWIWQCYGSPSHLLIRGRPLLSSASGVQQGDPLGPFLFSLALHPVLSKLKTDTTHPLAYMDDIYLTGKPDGIVSLLHTISEGLAPLKLRINPTKSWATLRLPAPWDAIRIDEHPRVLKVPLYPDESTGPVDPDTIELIDEIANLDDTQIAILLLRYVNNCTQVHSLRTSLPEANKQRINSLHAYVNQALSKLLSHDVTEDAHVLTRINMPLGPGLGFTNLHTIEKEAFAASWLQSIHRLNCLDSSRFPIPIIDRPSSPLESIAQEALGDLILLRNDPCLQLQRLKVEQKREVQQSRAFASLPASQKVIVKSCQGKFAGSWLAAIPSENNLRLPSSLMRTALCLFLGLQIRPNNSTCPACRGPVEGNFDAHILKCVCQGANIVRHDAIKYCLADLAKQAKVTATIEKRTFVDSARRPDITLHNFGHDSKDVVLDVSVIDPNSLKIKPDDPPLKAATERARDKCTKYKGSIAPHQEFYPVAIESYGGILPECLQRIIKPLIKRDDEFVSPNWAAPSAKLYWYQRITMALWRHNAEKVYHFVKC